MLNLAEEYRSRMNGRTKAKVGAKLVCSAHVLFLPRLMAVHQAATILSVSHSGVP